MAFQMREIAVLRFVNFLTGLRSAPKPATPAKLFQTLIKRSAGQLPASAASSFSLVNRSWPSGIFSAAGYVVMLLSASIAKNVIVVVSSLLLVYGAAQASRRPDTNLASGCQIGSAPAAVRRFAGDANLSQHTANLGDVSQSDLYIGLFHGTSIHHSVRGKAQGECAHFSRKINRQTRWKGE
jgi:hypothetical protein